MLSTRVEPESYRMLVGRYRDLVLRIVNRFEGHVGSIKGDGLLAVFGHPRAHENDVRRAVARNCDAVDRVRMPADGSLEGPPDGTMTRFATGLRKTVIATVHIAT